MTNMKAVKRKTKARLSNTAKRWIALAKGNPSIDLASKFLDLSSELSALAMYVAGFGKLPAGGMKSLARLHDNLRTIWNTRPKPTKKEKNSAIRSHR